MLGCNSGNEPATMVKGVVTFIYVRINLYIIAKHVTYEQNIFNFHSCARSHRPRFPVFRYKHDARIDDCPKLETTIMTDSLSKYQYLNLWFAGISILVVRKKVPSLSLFRNSPSVTLILRLPLPSQGTREKAANKKRRNGSGRS